MNDPREQSGSTGPGPSELEAARLVLARMGVAPEDLVGASVGSSVVPTFAEYVPVVQQAVSVGTRRVYGSYWKRVLEVWGSRRLDEPTASEVKQLAEWVRSQRVLRRNARGGRSAVEHCIAALRCVYRHAVADGLLSESQDPARRVVMPRRLPSTRRGLGERPVAELNRVAASTGNDPALDTLLLRLHTETACRRGGALALRVADLDPQQCLVLLREKNDTVRWQPVSPTLMRHLREHADQRGAHASGDGRVLRYHSGAALTHRRYDHLWHRLGRHVSWVATQQVSTHWLRYTTLTWVERHFGYAVARAYAGHTDHAGQDGATATYVRAGLPEIATALTALTGEDHPLAQPG
ncbi:Phage integrase family protein [Actinopolyspora xinjiangensis]|uniref:Phage integrase family protein n=1 Tax=Actinopolyspora xinjiangensis TaxID=405564 RepID=A0A1H0WJE2_9ACTN|nr:site-specific integrase [Actinopolyspora xinjiangensis]SDP90834.1 Phage integrase family protein [Actinopolyspora xinjiangensis]